MGAGCSGQKGQARKTFRSIVAGGDRPARAQLAQDEHEALYQAKWQQDWHRCCQVTIIEAKGLTVKDKLTFSSDPYVLVQSGNFEGKTAYKKVSPTYDVDAGTRVKLHELL